MLGLNWLWTQPYWMSTKYSRYSTLIYFNPRLALIFSVESMKPPSLCIGFSTHTTTLSADIIYEWNIFSPSLSTLGRHPRGYPEWEPLSREDFSACNLWPSRKWDVLQSPKNNCPWVAWTILPFSSALIHNFKEVLLYHSIYFCTYISSLSNHNKCKMWKIPNCSFAWANLLFWFKTSLWLAFLKLSKIEFPSLPPHPPRPIIIHPSRAKLQNSAGSPVRARTRTGS